MTPRARLLLAAFLAVAAYAIDHFLWKPLSIRAGSAEAGWEAALLKVEKMTRQASRLDRLTSDLTLLAQSGADLERALPKIGPTIGQVGRIQDLARKNDLLVLEMLPEKRVARQNFIEIKYDVAVLAGVRDLEKFLADLALEEWSVQAVKLVWGPPQSNGKSRAALKLVFYQYKS